MSKYTALVVAKWFINKNIRTAEDCNSEEITLLKVCQLLYYAEGCSLAFGKGSLFSDPILTQKDGVSVETVCNYYKEDPRHLPFGTDQDYDDILSISVDDELLLADVYNHFGQYTAWGLSKFFSTEVPWLESSNKGTMFGKEISRSAMQEYFAKHYVYDVDDEDDEPDINSQYEIARKENNPTIFDVANYFLLKQDMSHKKLQQLCYYSESWSWALLNRTLTNNASFEAWVHGASNYEAYEVYKKFGWNKIKLKAEEKEKVEKKLPTIFDEAQLNLLDSVWDTYGEMSGDELEEQIHSEEPWIKARGNAGMFETVRNVISTKEMRKFYRSVYTGEIL